MTDRSFDGICGGSGTVPPCGLGDISHGETAYYIFFYFSILAEVTVDIPETLPLSIFTAGVEVDLCGRKDPDLLPSSPDKIVAILKQPEETWVDSIQIYVDALSSWKGITAFCIYDKNDPLGSIVKFYKAPGYGAGVHEEFARGGEGWCIYTVLILF